MEEVTQELTQTEQVLVDMLKENTGIHMLDSGGAYGRHWQQNQGRDFPSEPEVVYEAELYYRNGEENFWIDGTVNIYHFLRKRLEYNERMDKIWQKFCNRKVYEDMYYPELMLRFASICEGTGWKKRNYRSEYGIPKSYDDYKTEEDVIYTYNHENCLSQDIQYLCFYPRVKGQPENHREAMVLLQIHGGCDARGGLTAPKVFDLDNFDYYLSDNGQTFFTCPTCGAWWEDIDMAGKYVGQEYESRMLSQTEKAESEGQLPLIEGLPINHKARAVDFQDCEKYTEETFKEALESEEPLPKNYLLVKDDKKMLCPMCHLGILEIGVY